MNFTVTNSSLATFRSCPRKYALAYSLQLVPTELAEALDVGSCWHKLFELDPELHFRDWLYENAPSELWAEKLWRLWLGYQSYWRDGRGPDFDVTEVEVQFRLPVTLMGGVFRGMFDARIRMADGRTGILERKTTGDDISPESSYWDRLRLDTQVGAYGEAEGRPDVILYDVVRKPTIRPKAILKADKMKILQAIQEGDRGIYFGEIIDAEDLAAGLETGKETLIMYGARLAKDIDENPEKYFARRPIGRTSEDYDLLQRDFTDQLLAVRDLEASLVEGTRRRAYRNPNACDQYGRCQFFGICSQNLFPENGDPPPQGFVRRAHRPPELDGDD